MSPARNEENLGSVKALGKHTDYDFQYNKSLLETFDNRHPELDYFVNLECSEFSSLCPITSQPDWAVIYIRYIPNIKMVESKSLKLYLNSFRNQGDFHEDVVNIIMKDLRDIMEVRYIEVLGVFHPRGGIAIHPFTNWADSDHQEYVMPRKLAATFAEITQLGRHLR